MNHKLMRKSSLAEAVSAAIIASVIATPVLAAEDDAKNDERIIVTATKSAEAIQEVPLAITSLSGEFMEEVHLDDIKDLIAYTPGITGNSTDSFLDSISIRGVRTDDYGAGGDLSNAVFKNDLYEGRTGSAVSTLFDMDRAEVVRGPQGFLFGRNAIGGAISSHTRRAEMEVTGGYLDIELAEFNKIKVEAGVNVPVTDNFAMRFSGVYHTEESFIDNNYPGGELPDTDTQAIRWSTTYEGSSFNVFTMVEYEDRQHPGTAYRAITEGPVWEEFMSVYGDYDYDGNGNTLNNNGGIRGDARSIDTDAMWGIQDNSENLNLQLKLEKEFSWADLTINAGYKDHDYFYSEDWEGTPLPIGSWKNDQSGDYSQLEFRLNDKGDGPLGWYVGASLYQENLDVLVSGSVMQDHLCQYYSYYAAGWGAPESGPGRTCATFYYGYYALGPNDDPNMLETSHVDAKNDGWAAYINLDYQITDTVDAEIGIRHSVDNKDISNSL
ncbi:MAG: TonB-dependent receptor, partial [Gammaproteobacteria bacterium]